MVNKKKIQKIVSKYAQDSFERGHLSSKTVLFYSSEFRKLPGSQAIIYLQEYIKAVKMIEDKSTLFIETSVPLTSSQKTRIVGSLKKDFQITKIITKINPSLLGGIRVKIGDHIYEDSLISRIEALGEFING